MSGEFVTTVPAIFNEYELEDLVYIETRREPDSSLPLSGNLDTSRNTLNESTFSKTTYRGPFEVWRHIETSAAQRRLRRIQELSGLALITTPDSIMPHLNQAEGHLHLYADEAPVVIFAPGTEAVIHLKVDHLALAKETILRTLYHFGKKGYDVSSAGVYIGPHAHSLPLNAHEFAEMNAAISAGSADVKQAYRMFTRIDDSGHPVLDFSSMLFHQLEGGGIRPGDIELSNENTYAKNSRYFSKHRADIEGTVEGRFGILIGKRPKQ